ncbi:M16 family metallopeptidase [Mangrovibacterium diazotrophicum]|uniref:Zinc protease n=1 Tax=Mangrovibacterium diazotrophicum TaxID=1261403 RepID=A0A419W7A8_9BACT|nr:M16 family metallopeptidase [Mangrovibacterium diazotrophicum]RKD91348.1 zinc protease [Mangrovibacterium diazotrophicum]
MKLIRFSFMFLFLLCFSLASQAQMSTTIPLNENVVSGVLPNKMHYYIMHNEFPKDRVSFYFPQNVGSMQENDSQKGLAHFLEHMAFNGTEHFAGKGFLDMLQKYGVRFGADINAYTAYDETVYNLSNVPTNEEPWLIDSCLYVLHDWSGALSLQEDEIDAERGVIREEWRTRRTPSYRIHEQTSQTLFKGSKYAERMPIGDIDIVNNFEYQVLRDYYNKWYRPDLQAVVIVGDIDPLEMEKKVKAIFSEIPLKKDRAERTYDRIPDHKEPYFCLATDKEEKYVRIMYYETSDKPAVKDEKYLRDERINSLIFSMVNNRLNEYVQNNQTNVLGAQTLYSDVARLQRNFILFLAPKPGQEVNGFREVYTEWQRAYRFGFTQSELDRSKENTLSQYENFVANKDKVENNDWAEQLYNYFLEAEPFVTPETELATQKEILAGITLEDVNAAIKKIQTGKNQVITVTGPETEGAVYPGLEDFEKVIAEVNAEKLEPYVEADAGKPLVAEDLKLVPVNETFAVEGLEGATGYVLANGARVVLYPTDLAKDEILFSAYSWGGSSLVDQADLASAGLSVDLIESSGLGDFKATDLSKKLAGKIVSIQPSIGELTEGFGGSTNQKDFETLTQLIYLYFTHARVDENAYNNIINQYEAYLKNAAADNNKAMRDTISLVSTNYNPRTLLMNQSYVDMLNMNRAGEIFKERFSNAADFTFVFVGNVNESMLPAIQTYIGNIPSTGKQEAYVDHHMNPKEGETTRNVVRPMNTPKTTVYLKMSGELDQEADTKLTMYYIGQLLSKRYLVTVREEEGGSYGVSASGGFSTLPENRFAVTISFDTNPEKANRIMEVVFQEIEALKEGKIDMKEFNEVKASIMSMREQGVKTNRYWLRDIMDYLQTGDKIYNDDEYKALLDGVTPEKVAALAKKVLDNPTTVEVLMSPAETAAN